MTAAATRKPSGFDPGLAANSTREFPVAEVVDLLELMHAAERIREYRERKRADWKRVALSLARRLRRRGRSPEGLPA